MVRRIRSPESPPRPADSALLVEREMRPNIHATAPTKEQPGPLRPPLDHHLGTGQRIVMCCKGWPEKPIVSSVSRMLPRQTEIVALLLARRLKEPHLTRKTSRASVRGQRCELRGYMVKAKRAFERSVRMRLDEGERKGVQAFPKRLARNLECLA